MKKPDVQKHIEFCDDFLQQLKPVQETMLNLQLRQVQPQLEKLFKDCFLFFDQVKMNFSDVTRPSKYFILKKQVDLIHGYLENMIKENETLLTKDEQAVIIYFEKQFKLKKIIKKHLQDFNRLQ